MAHKHPDISLDNSFVMVHSAILPNYKNNPGRACPKCDKLYKTAETLRKHEELCAGRKIMVGFSVDFIFVALN